MKIRYVQKIVKIGDKERVIEEYFELESGIIEHHACDVMRRIFNTHGDYYTYIGITDERLLERYHACDTNFDVDCIGFKNFVREIIGYSKGDWKNLDEGKKLDELLNLKHMNLHAEEKITKQWEI